ncbi:PREDICTED: protein phosphatase 1 regulatory subunit 35 [Gekko japonicus]|uniref:Protein phosphatase 1 regulatory subunit 35 n=1 Tax=Gekko japonicus TaxID=146911 RepID=A0ABM1KQ37_GEKJA|nr:PREDICTED: protein phosphatase 1 regulatory subunit 35 [Gekko japonicus]
MAGPGGGDEDSLPCAAPAPLPAPPVQPLIPDPAVVLTPDREGGGGGILRRRGPGNIRRRQVRFRLDSGSHEVGGGHLDLLGRVEETQGASTSSLAPSLLTREPCGSLAEDGHLNQPSGLSTPILHSSIALGAEVQAAREQDFDARRAARELLQHSFPTRCAVEARVGESMNIPREQQLYQGLVSLQVPKEELLSSAMKEKLVLVGPRPEGQKELASEGPDLMAFYDPEELFTETAFLEVEGLPPLEQKPRARDPAATFLMYRKLRQWNS